MAAHEDMVNEKDTANKDIVNEEDVTHKDVEDMVTEKNQH